MQAAAYNYRAVVHCHQGAGAQAIADCQEGARVAERAGDRFRIYLLQFYEGQAYLMTDDPGRARQVLDSSIALAKQLGTTTLLAWGLGLLASALLALDEDQPVPTLCEEAINVAEDTRDRLANALAHRTLAEALARLTPSDVDRPEGALRDAIRIHQELGCRPELARSYLTYARLLNGWGRLDEASAVPPRGDRDVSGDGHGAGSGPRRARCGRPGLVTAPANGEGAGMVKVQQVWNRAQWDRAGHDPDAPRRPRVTPSSFTVESVRVTHGTSVPTIWRSTLPGTGCPTRSGRAAPPAWRTELDQSPGPSKTLPFETYIGVSLGRFNEVSSLRARRPMEMPAIFALHCARTASSGAILALNLRIKTLSGPDEGRPPFANLERAGVPRSAAIEDEGGDGGRIRSSAGPSSRRTRESANNPVTSTTAVV